MGTSASDFGSGSASPSAAVDAAAEFVDPVDTDVFIMVVAAALTDIVAGTSGVAGVAGVAGSAGVASAVGVRSLIEANPPLAGARDEKEGIEGWVGLVIETDGKDRPCSDATTDGASGDGAEEEEEEDDKGEDTRS